MIVLCQNLCIVLSLKCFSAVLTLLNGTMQYDTLVLHQYFLFQRCSWLFNVNWNFGPCF